MSRASNVAIEYRWAEGSYDRVPAFAAELVQTPGRLIVTVGGKTCGCCGEGRNHNDPHRVRPPAPIRSSWGWSAASPDRAAMRQE